MTAPPEGNTPGMPKLTDEERARVPSTLARSDEHAQETFVRTLESAETVRGHEGDASYAHRVAFSAVKHGYEKVGDHWEPKEHAGPSDPQAELTGEQARQGRRETRGGVDANASKKHLYELAKRLEVPGRSTMDRDELARAVQKASDRATAKARADG